MSGEGREAGRIMKYAVNCRLCGVTVVLADRLDDAETAVMEEHLREYHTAVLPEGRPADFAILIPNFRLRMA
jgi:hypothetical protein